MNNIIEKDERTSSLQVLFAILIFGTAASAFILANLYQDLTTPDLIDPSVLVLRHRVGLSPKPVERFVFLLLLFVVPTVAYALILKGAQTPVRSIAKGIKIFVPALLGIGFFYPFVGFDFSQALLSGKSMPPEHPLRFMGVCVLLAVAWYGWISSRGPRSIRPNRLIATLAWCLFITAMLLQIGAWRLVSVASLTVAATWWNSADAVMYTISQVFAGKTVLVDMPSQYGLFAEIVAPLFRVIDLSVFSFTALWAILQVVSLSAVFHVMQKYIREPAIKVTAGLALVMLTFETSLWLIGIDERYWQYWPIRFLWPALSVLAFHSYTRRNTIGRLLVVSAIGAIGSIWNADSGLVIVIALAAFIVGKLTFLFVKQRATSRRERRDLITALALHAAIFVLAVAAMTAYLMAKSGHALNWGWLFEYQRIFYGTGFMMMPIPTAKPSPWMPIIAVYLVGMMYALSSWMKYPQARASDLMFYLSFLGVGLFVYYEGRSHILNLVTVCWPALMLAAILSDRVVRAYRAGLLPRYQLCLPTVTLALLLFCCIPLLRYAPDLAKESVVNFETRGVPVDAQVVDELAFIRAHSVRGEQCLILAYRQGLYYAETGLVSPVSGPGYSELITSRDRDLLINQLERLKAPCVFVGVGKDSAVELEVDPVSALKQYVVQSKSAKGTMLFLRPRA